MLSWLYRIFVFAKPLNPSKYSFLKVPSSREWPTIVALGSVVVEPGVLVGLVGGAGGHPGQHNYEHSPHLCQCHGRHTRALLYNICRTPSTDQTAGRRTHGSPINWIYKLKLATNLIDDTLIILNIAYARRNEFKKIWFTQCF